MDDNELYEVLRTMGWYYDNGWLHDSISWDCYIDDNYGRYPYYVILARNGNGRLLRLTQALTKEENRAGPLASRQNVDDLMSFLKDQRSFLRRFLKRK